MAKQEKSMETLAVECLIGGFSEVIRATFEKSAIISSEANIFGNFDKATQQRIVNSAFAQGVAQNLAAIFVQYPKVPQVEIYNNFMTMLKHETDSYHKQMLTSLEEMKANAILMPVKP